MSQPDSPTALADLIAAGLVSHEVIGDPARLAEPEALKALCGLVGGPIWRIEPFHYAFRAGPGDLGGALADQAAEDWAAAIEAALQAALGADAAWVNATDLLPEAPVPLDQPLLLLRAHAAAVTAGLEAADPGLQAVINARFAAATARLAADDAAGPLAERLAALEAGQAGILAAVEARAGLGSEIDSELRGELARLTETLAAVLQRLDAQADALHAHVGREDMVAGRLAELSALAAGPAAFQETLGVTLAEFLARIERREAEPARAPQAGA